MGTKKGTLVASTTKSLVSRDGNSRQPSVRDVAALLMATEPPSSETSERVVILAAILQGITENTMSGDIISLGVYRAESLCQQWGVSPGIFQDTVKRFLSFSEVVRKANPLSGMF